MIRYFSWRLITVLLLLCFTQCKEQLNGQKHNAKVTEKQSDTLQKTNVDRVELLIQKPTSIEAPEGMIWIPGGVFEQGARTQDKFAMQHEKPAHRVAVDGFFMDVTEVTNAQFKEFVKATGYQTVAEQAIDWQEMKKELPLGTAKPHDSILQPGSLVFKRSKIEISNLYDFSQWWMWAIGANWKHPKGPGSSIEGKDAEPVVHIAYADAEAYCKWANRRLPTEAEWERAARGNSTSIFFWGDDETQLKAKANTWEGQFPSTNTKADGFEGLAPVKSFSSNDFGLYDMAGNVWEWTSDWYHTNYYQSLAGKEILTKNPTGAKQPLNTTNPYAKEKVIKGGSFLCNSDYCANYRITARMATSLDSSLEHLGFRTVATVAMLQTTKKK